MSYKFQNGAAKLGGAIDATALTGAISPDSMSDGINAVVTAGSALTKTFNDGADTVTFDVGVDDSSIEVSSDALQVKALGVTNAMLAGSIADSKLNTISTADKVAGSAVQLNANGGLFNDSGLALSASVAGDGLAFASGVLSVGVDDSSIETNSDALRVKAAGITNAMLSGAIADGKLAQDYIQTSEVDDSSIEFSGSALQVKALGVTNDMLAGSIANAKLANSTISGKALGTSLDGLSQGAGIAAFSYDGSTSGVTVALSASVAGDGLAFAAGVLSVGVDDSSIELSGDAVQVKALGVTNAMLAGSIADSKLNQITTGDKVAGSAVQLAATSSIEDSTGLRLKSSVAGDGLIMAAQVLGVNVDDSSIETNSDALRVKALGITNAMLAGSIDDSKLNTISTADKVAGSAVQLQSNKGLENSSGLGVVLKANAGLEVDSSGIAVSLSGSTLASDAGGLHLSSSVAGHGLFFGLDQLEVRHSVGTLGSTPATLAYGINVQTVDMTGSLTHTLPTPVVAGRTVIVKAKNAAANTMTIATGATGDKIDGVLDDIAIESDGGAVTLMGVAADRWIIV